MTCLVLFTTNHPFTFTGGECMFVGPELAHLARRFGSLVVVPLYDRGQQLALPADVTLDRSLAADWRRPRWRHLLRAPCWPGFWPEFGRGLRHGGWIGAARVWRWAAFAQAAWAWLNTKPQFEQPTLFYSYWRGGQTLAAVRWADAHPACRVVTRVHGYDLYPNAFSPPFQPWVSVYRRLARVITISQHGADFLQAQGVEPARLLLSRLGVSAAPRPAAASADGVLRVVSCSNVIELKRVDRIAEALCELARRLPQRRIEWTHFGAGNRIADVRTALRNAPANLSSRLAGQVPNEAVRSHYATEPVDLFVLFSRSEGLPVSIQEALAAGIPVLATDVGGVSEAVNRSGDNGGLLPADASVQNLAAALELQLVEPDPEAVAARRAAAWQRWACDFDAERNHSHLALSLVALLDD